MKVVDKIGAPVSLLSVAFFGFSRSGVLAGIILGSKKKVVGNSPAGPLTSGGEAAFTPLLKSWGQKSS